jgi:hypothetical protein
LNFPFGVWLSFGISSPFYFFCGILRDFAYDLKLCSPASRPGPQRSNAKREIQNSNFEFLVWRFFPRVALGGSNFEFPVWRFFQGGCFFQGDPRRLGFRIPRLAFFPGWPWEARISNFPFGVFSRVALGGSNFEFPVWRLFQGGPRRLEFQISRLAFFPGWP